MQLPDIQTFWERSDRDTIAIVGPDHAPWTVGAVQDAANQVANQLLAQGCVRNDAVAVCTRNSPEVLVLNLAITQLGMYVVPLSWHLTAPEAAYIIQDSGARLVFAGPNQAARVRDAGVPTYSFSGTVEGCRRWAELLTGPTHRPAERWAGGPMTYTSGTTGQPKGVRRPLPSAPPEPVAKGYAMFLLMYGMVPGDGVHLVVSPLYHTAVLYFATSSLHLGHLVVIMDKWTPDGMLECIQRYQVTSSHMVPTQFSRLLNAPGHDQYDTSSLRHMVHSAAPCPVPVKWAMLAWWGDCVFEYYAASEGGGTMITPQEWRARPGSVGRPWATAEIAIFDEEGHRLPPDEVGTVYIKMQQGFAYHRDQAKTEKAWRTDGYFTVGDAGYLDAAGYLFLCDRKADMIISGGVNIYPAEVESALSGHPLVLDVAVFGIPDPDWGEQVKAVVELKASAPAGFEQALIAWTRERIAGFKCPKTIDFVDSLPREANGKLKKRLLRDPYWEGTGRQI
jgi:long-chain acyl-CoA synthetase